MTQTPVTSLDGYHLVRKIGEGGFGEVWLARSETTGGWKAMKWISATAHRHLEQELSSLRKVVLAMSSVRSPHLVPIEHARVTAEGLYYIMPLADGSDDISPEQECWQPQSLALWITRHRDNGSWFTSQNIKTITLGVLTGAQAIADAGLVHRDIKPENVLFLGGKPCLADFGLAAEEATMVSMRGTPHHAAPSWYLESGGNADQWGVAALLYVLLTGNSPDKMGRARFLWPPSGQEGLTKLEQAEWHSLHHLVNRATSEKAKERFHGLQAFQDALMGSGGSGVSLAATPPKKSSWPIIALLALVLLFSGVAFLVVSKRGSTKEPSPPATVSTAQPQPSSPVQAKTEYHSPVNENDVHTFYRPDEVEKLNDLIARGDQQGIHALEEANLERCRKVIRSLPPHPKFSDIMDKMLEAPEPQKQSPITTTVPLPPDNATLVVNGIVTSLKKMNQTLQEEQKQREAERQKAAQPNAP